VGYATPGIFPILKESEYKSSVAAPNDPFLVKAEYPYTRFSFRVRRTLRLVAEDLGPGAAGGSRSLADTTGIDAALASHSVAVKVGDTAYQATFTESKAQTDQVAIAYAIPEDAWTALEGLAEDKRTEAEGAMKAAILDAIRAQLSAKHVDAGNATLAVALVHPR